MTPIKAPSNNDKLIDLDFFFNQKVGSMDVILYERDDGTCYERVGTARTESFYEVSTDRISEDTKLKHLRENREEYLKTHGAFQYALLVNQLHESKKKR